MYKKILYILIPLVVLVVAYFVFFHSTEPSPVIPEGSTQESPVASSTPAFPVDATLKVGESYTIDELTTIKFVRVVSDSRCAVEVVCIWQGSVIVEVEEYSPLIETTETSTTTLETGKDPVFFVGGYLISLRDVTPPANFTIPLKPEDYNVVFHIDRAE